MKNLTIVVLLCILLSASNTMAQSHVVYGVVHTFDSIPLIGVEVLVKSTKQTVLTDSIGKFSAICMDKDKLKIRAKGFVDETVNVTPNIKLVAINMKMKPGKKQREYAIGYGYISEKDRTTAITNLQKDDTDFSNFSSMYDLIRSMGGQIEYGHVKLRGSTSFQGNSAALIVLDGVISDNEVLRTLSPRQVKSINLLKDGSTAVYGSRGANGVVIIETKKGGDE